MSSLTSMPVSSLAAQLILSPTATPVSSLAAQLILSPTATPVFSPAAQLIPSPTATPFSSPAAQLIPSPTATPVSSLAATPIPSPTATPVSSSAATWSLPHPPHQSHPQPPSRPQPRSSQPQDQCLHHGAPNGTSASPKAVACGCAERNTTTDSHPKETQNTCTCSWTNNHETKKTVCILTKACSWNGKNYLPV